MSMKAWVEADSDYGRDVLVVTMIFQKTASKC